MTTTSIVTFPLMVLTPLIWKARLPLFGVKVTSKRVALKLLFVWHVLSDEDVSIRSAAANGSNGVGDCAGVTNVVFEEGRRKEVRVARL